MISATKKWILLKITSFFMVPFMVWFLINFAKIHNANYQTLAEFFSNQFYALIFSIFIIIFFSHSALSISEIFEDYVTSEKTRKFAKLMSPLTKKLTKNIKTPSMTR